MRCFDGSVISSASICSVFESSDLDAESASATLASAKIKMRKIGRSDLIMTAPWISSARPSGHEFHQRANAFDFFQAVGDFNYLLQCRRADAHLRLKIAHQLDGIGESENMVAAAVFNLFKILPLGGPDGQFCALRANCVVPGDCHAIQ